MHIRVEELLIAGTATVHNNTGLLQDARKLKSQSQDPHSLFSGKGDLSLFTAPKVPTEPSTILAARNLSKNVQKLYKIRQSPDFPKSLNISSGCVYVLLLLD